MLERLTRSMRLNWLKHNVRTRKVTPKKIAAHQRAYIRGHAGGFAAALWALYISVFGIVARDDNTLFGTAVADFG